MYMWERDGAVSRKTPSIVFVPGASVNERIFALPTIETNTVEYFTRVGYHCFAVVTRFGNTPNVSPRRGLHHRSDIIAPQVDLAVEESL